MGVIEVVCDDTPVLQSFLSTCIDGTNGSHDGFAHMIACLSAILSFIPMAAAAGWHVLSVHQFVSYSLVNKCT